MQVEIQQLPERYVAYIRRLGAYGPEIGACFEQLMGWAGNQGLLGAGEPETLALYWDNPDVTPAEQCRSDACLVVPERVQPQGPVATQRIPAGSYAVARFELRDDQFGPAWDRLVGEWLPSSGYQPDERPCYEVYHGCRDGVFTVDLCIPVKPR